MRSLPAIVLVLLSAPSLADIAAVRTDTGLVQGVLDDDVIVYKEPLAGKCGHGHESTPRPRTARHSLTTSPPNTGTATAPSFRTYSSIPSARRRTTTNGRLAEPLARIGHRTDIRSRHDAGFGRAFSDGHLHEREEGSVIAPPKTIAGSRAVPHWEQIFRT